eukprot:7372596-Ditylum_brightwellii.AAC.1
MGLQIFTKEERTTRLGSMAKMQKRLESLEHPKPISTPSESSHKGAIRALSKKGVNIDPTTPEYVVEMTWTVYKQQEEL